MLAGAKSLAAIGEWITDAPLWALRTLGFEADALTGRVRVPHPATVRRILLRVDGAALDTAVGTWPTRRDPKPSRTYFTVDGYRVICGRSGCPGGAETGGIFRQV
ncbi:transposase family protein [Streptomyces sp. BPTC-684]|uniref:transposase family protein n=1 Tax=Streptomyces sp. BPTC-684 TaxID=3043734 RepID=UPI0024B08DA3|nr:transposase family protein [Streptomyces sp. BPTC-684]WHM40990.1 transposase family protein [Streptomyces sp. BPTC-684]